MITGETRTVPVATLRHMEEASMHVAQMEAGGAAALAKNGRSELWRS